MKLCSIYNRFLYEGLHPTGRSRKQARARLYVRDGGG